MTLSMFDAKAKYTADNKPSGPMRGCAMMKPQVSISGASATAIEGKSTASGIRWNWVAKTGAAAMSTVAAAAMVILSGCSKDASRLDTTAATMTATGPFGQAIANQIAEVIPTASAERIPTTTAGTGSDQSPHAMFGRGNSSPRSKAPMSS